MTMREQYEEILKRSGLTGGEIALLTQYALSIGIAFMLEETAGRNLDREALHKRADELYGNVLSNIAMHRKELGEE